MQISKREKKLLILCGIVAIVLSAAKFYFMPLKEKSDQLAGELPQKRYELEDRRGRLALQENKYTEKVRTAQKELDLLKSRFINEKNAAKASVELLNGIEKAAKDSNVQIQTKTVLGFTEEQRNKKISVEFDFLCNDKQLTKFLYFLKANPKLYDITSLRIERQNSPLDLRVNVVISSFVI